MEEICNDLSNEYNSLDDIVKDLDDAGWHTLTPFLEWTVRDEISHLAFFDSTARLAATDPEGFNKHIEEIMRDPKAFDKKPRGIGRNMTIEKLLEWWREERRSLLAALRPLEPKSRIPWYGPPMSAKTFATARIMETWAHGQDVVDALGIKREQTNRLYHVAHIGVRTFGFSFSNNGLEVPDASVRVELKSPDNELWTWGPEDSKNTVQGPVEDFCLVVTQRRPVSKTAIVTNGDVAAQWMSIAQAFAGLPIKDIEPG
ncbi:MAG: TIGR03084 family metal-binding protein [Spirochaetota bacterium]|nr:TIGR03084 family metal-binding protein [Spirochaetota bacterium]